jgi:hypothetical protein
MCFHGSTNFGKREESIISTGVGMSMVLDKVLHVVLRGALRNLIGAQRAIIGAMVILENYQIWGRIYWWLGEWFEGCGYWRMYGPAR